MKTTKVLLYCTKGKPYLCRNLCRNYDNKFRLSNEPLSYILNGKIVAECEVETEELKCCCVPYRNKNNLGYEHYIDNGVYKVNWSSKDSINNNLDGDGVVFERNDKYIDTMLKNDDLSKMCLSPQQLYDYVGLGNKFYALHVKNLKMVHSLTGSVYASGLKMIDRNKENTRAVRERFKNKNFVALKYIDKAPQNMCFVLRLNQNEEYYDHYVLISIRPEWLCKILNGEKTIEVRRKVLKEMISDE